MKKEINPLNYWALDPTDIMAMNLAAKVDSYYTHIRTTGKLAIWRRCYIQYYNNIFSGVRLRKMGPQGEYTQLNVNHYYNILAHIKTLTVSQRPAFECRSTNTDYRSQSQTILATTLLEYYMKTKGLENYMTQAVEDSLLYGEGFVRVEWDSDGGKPYSTTPTGAVVYDGDVKYKNFTPLDVIRDFNKQSSRGHDWLILRDFRNKYNVAAKFPEFKDQILNAAREDTGDINDNRFLNTVYDVGDDIPVYSFYHKPTPAVPKGRYIEYIDDTVLLDGPLPYRDLPVYRIAPNELNQTPFGYTVGFDLVPIQQEIDTLYATIATNQETFGVQNVLVPTGSNINAAQVSGGLNFITYDPKNGKPEAMNLTATPPEIFNHIITLQNQMETLSGVNSVARGNPEASLKSGAALALVQSTAIQFNMPLQQSYARLVEGLGVATINILKDYAKTPRVAQIAGKSNRSYLKEFTGEDLDTIDRVIVDLGNPLTQTTAGKVNLAETLLQNKLVTDADQYIQVLTTGRLEPVIEGKQAELMLIRSENETLQNDGDVIAIATDNHAQHIIEHKVLLASPEARMNPDIVGKVLKHIQEHITLLQTVDPNLLKLIGQESLSPPSSPQANPSPMLNAMNPTLQAAGNVNLPNSPRNPLTGEVVQLPQGALINPNGRTS